MAKPKGKKTAEKANGRGKPRGPKIIDGEAYLHRDDFMELEMLHSRMAMYAESARRRTVEAEHVELKAATRAKALRSEGAVADKERRNVEKQLHALQEKLSKKYELDFKSVLYDDETGKITVHAPQE